MMAPARRYSKVAKPVTPVAPKYSAADIAAAVAESGSPPGG